MMNRSLAVATALAALAASACASDPEARPAVPPVFGLSTLASGPPEATVVVRPARGAPAIRPAGSAPAGDPSVSAPTAGAGDTLAFTIETRITERAAPGRVIHAPRITVFPGQRANVTVIDQTSFIQDFDAERVGDEWWSDPIVGILQEGIVMDLLAAPSARSPRAVDLGFRVQFVELEEPIRQRTVRFSRDAVSGTIQLPRMAITSVSGARRLGIGETVTIAEIPGGAGGSPVDVEVRVVPVVMNTATDFPGDEIALEEFLGPDIARVPPQAASDGHGDGPDLRTLVSMAAARDHAPGRLRLEAVVLTAELELGVALDEAAAEAIPGASQLSLRSMELATAPVPGAEVRSLLQESYLRSYDTIRADGPPVQFLVDPVVDTLLAGVTGTLEEGGKLRLEWTTVPSLARVDSPVGEGFQVSVDVPELQTHRLLVPLRAGRQLVPVAHMTDGGTAAIWVGFRPVD